MDVSHGNIFRWKYDLDVVTFNRCIWNICGW